MRYVWRVRVALAIVVAAVQILPAASAQETEPATPEAAFGEAIRVRVVNVEVFVRDRQGNPVTNLTAEDFRLTVDGSEVPISNFYAEVDGAPRSEARLGDAATEAPLPDRSTPPEQRIHVVLFVDQSQIRPANRERVFAELRRFVRRSLRPEDAVAVVSLSNRLRIHSDFLNDPATVEAILDELEEESGSPQALALERRQIVNDLGRGQTGGGFGPNPFAESTLARIRAFAQESFSRNRASVAVLERLVDSMAGIPGRKAIVHVSDGIVNRPGEGLYVAWRNVFGSGGLASEPTPGLPRIDFGTDYERSIGRFDLLPDFERVADQANAGGVTLYAIDAEGDHATALRSAVVESPPFHEAIERLQNNAREPLEFAAQATGGKRFQASPRLARELASVATDFGTYYSLGFEPPVDYGEEPHDIQVRVEGEGLVVRHREAFAQSAPDESAADATVAILLYGAIDNPLGIRLEAGEPERLDDGVVRLPVHLLVPLRRVTLLPDGEVWVANLSVFVSTKDKTGAPRSVQKLPFHLRVPQEATEDIESETAHYELPVVLRPGDQQVAVVVRDQPGGVDSAARLEVVELAPALDGVSAREAQSREDS